MGRHNLIWKTITTKLYNLTLFFVFLILFPICITLFLPIYLIRFLLAMAVKLFRPDLGKLIHTRSTVIATDSPSHDPKWNICSWLTLEGNLNFDQFRETFLQDIVLEVDSTGELVSPEYQQCYTTWLGFLFWKWEKAFDVREHMRYYFDGRSPDYFEKVTTEKELRQVIKELTAEPFQSGKSPWEFLFIPNFIEGHDPGTNSVASKSVLIFRVHHGFCDGYAMLWLVLEKLNNVMLDTVAKPRVVKKSLCKKVFDGLFFAVRAPYEFMELIVKSYDRNSWHLTQNELKRPFNTAFTPRIPLEYIKEIKNANNVSFITVVLAAITAGLRKSMIESGVKIPRKLTTGVPVPMPGHPHKLRNHFIFSFLPLPVGVSDPIERLTKIEKYYSRLKQSSAIPFAFMVIPIVGGLFTWMIDWFNYNYFSTAVISIFPGPAYGGNFTAGGNNNKCLDINFSGAVGVGNVGVAFCMLSYADGMRIITSTDKSILPTDEAVQELNNKIQEEVGILKTWNMV